MRSLLLSLSLLLMTTLATPALAGTPTAGDLFWVVPLGGHVLHHDAETGAITTVSCWDADNFVCSTPIGSGPEFPYVDQHLSVGPDGWLYLHGTISSSPFVYGAVRIDPVTGNREVVVEGATLPFAWPAPNYFPVTVASIGGWGAALLVSGIFIGVQLRMKKTAEA